MNNFNKIPIPDKDYVVVVAVITYNHAKYIEEALKSIIMQRVSFPIVALVIDDCSNDGTTEIVHRYEHLYPDLIKGFYFEENQSSQGGAFRYAFPWINHAKYIALCEGDDYWTDPLKLQKQVDFMESHEDCTLCIHNALVKWESGERKDHLQYSLEDREYKASDIINNWIVSTASVLFRSDIFRNSEIFKILKNDDFFVKDVPLWLFCASKGKIFALKDVMCVYRRLNDGFTSQFESEYKRSADPNFKYCLHDITINKFFGGVFDDEFKNTVKDNYFYHNRLGMLVSIINQDVNSLKMLFLQSMSVSFIRTIGSIFIVSKMLAKRIIKYIIKKP